MKLKLVQIQVISE